RRAGVVGIREKADAGFGGSGDADEGRVFSDLLRGAVAGGLSGRGLVSENDAGAAGPDFAGACGRWKTGRGVGGGTEFAEWRITGSNFALRFGDGFRGSRMRFSPRDFW